LPIATVGDSPARREPAWAPVWLSGIARLLLGLTFAATVGTKFRFGLAENAFLPTWIQAVSGCCELLIALGLLVTRRPVFERLSLAFGLVALAAVSAFHAVAGADIPCGCLGRSIDLSWEAHGILVGTILTLSGLCLMLRTRPGPRVPQ